ncbi:hypothetical protein [Gloeothece verrucosa]|uniref:Uncharacterized protein n=1 Tax=Gloeothece verrucosa (strain PCC 7822) TaxID=497965 RepID=E0UP14_GLOV7|nr:hypothetical protein [Gloeothece verrucosa]ADN18694.1 hypothetical protein Cyan7822_6212 [Gloeothece verrucosa PCC 7822]
MTKDICLVYFSHDMSCASIIFERAYPTTTIKHCDYIILNNVSISQNKPIIEDKLKNYAKDFDLKIAAIGNIDGYFEQWLNSLNISYDPLTFNLNDYNPLPIIRNIALSIYDFSSDKKLEEKIFFEMRQIDYDKLYKLPLLLQTVVLAYNYYPGMWGNL